MQNNKEKEPAPSANDTSSKEENLSKKNDSTEKAKCQEAVDYQEKYLKLSDIVNSTNEKLDKLKVILNDLFENYFSYNVNYNNFVRAIRLLNTLPSEKEKIAPADNAAKKLIVEFGRLQAFFDIALDYCHSIKILLADSREVSQ